MRRPPSIAVAALALSPSPAWACVLCDSPQAVSLRERLLRPDFWLSLGGVLLPLLLLGAVVARIAIGPADRGGAA